eukprot:CAMPEP_0202868978 /NCGR_PEP_ID=MMETSP1391-20130828/11518_1 /ASSEMBLY_ACC=CAM_ASM_000867 /TAXON_ID=1034604 /ORGANISM="Chlamydomonas leiostraca, Strain SAG 11-49" /LENGTH=231 /DNA_ID=CAMNT_0049549211 /DNA_START=76 /DNA_END=767 /DNA_ORIENTATION=+
MPSPSGAWRIGTLLSVCVLVLCLVQPGLAGDETGTGFPFIDNCREQLYMSQLRLTLIKEKVDPINGSEFCFLVTERDNCRQTENRCCNQHFTKIKLYIKGEKCMRSFLPCTVRNDKIGFYRVVSPVPEYATNSIKFTQFGPIDGGQVDGTEVCIRMRSAGGGGMCHSLQDITADENAPNNWFEAALYDKKSSNYECCPTFAFRTNGETTPSESPEPAARSPSPPPPKASPP